ncbi:MAG: glycosyltransferase family 2 protein [Nitrospirae bacterium]|nr:glycosyltransferase family 2 protein [Nitrospirota bacterium]
MAICLIFVNNAMDNSKKPTLTVAMPNYNDSRFISTAIEAILNQSRQPDEFIICDDGSSDNSIEIIQAYAKRYPIIKLIRNETNVGNVNIVNVLINAAAGDYLYFAASDDYILPGFLEKSMDMLKKYPDAGFSASFLYNMNERGKKTGIGYVPGMSREKGFMAPNKIFDIVCKIGSPEMFSANTMVFKRRSIIEAGGFPTEIRYFNDVVMSAAIAARHGACFIPEPLVCIRQRMLSYSSSYFNNPELFNEAIGNAVRYMRDKYSGVLPARYIGAFEKNMSYDGYFYNLSAARRSMLNQYINLPLRLTPAFLSMATYAIDAIMCLNYLREHRLSIGTYAMNYIDAVLYMRKNRHLLD